MEGTFEELFEKKEYNFPAIYSKLLYSKGFWPLTTIGDKNRFGFEILNEGEVRLKVEDEEYTYLIIEREHLKTEERSVLIPGRVLRDVTVPPMHISERMIKRGKIPEAFVCGLEIPKIHLREFRPVESRYWADFRRAAIRNQAAIKGISEQNIFELEGIFYFINDCVDAGQAYASPRRIPRMIAQG